MRYLNYLSTLIAAVCFLLSCWFLSEIRSNVATQGLLQQKQEELNAQQQEIQTRNEKLQVQQNQVDLAGKLTQETGPALLRDLASVADTNFEIKEILARRGLTVTKTAPESAPTAPVQP